MPAQQTTTAQVDWLSQVEWIVGAYVPQVQSSAHRSQSRSSRRPRCVVQRKLPSCHPGRCAMQPLHRPKCTQLVLGHGAELRFLRFRPPSRSRAGEHVVVLSCESWRLLLVERLLLHSSTRPVFCPTTDNPLVPCRLAAERDRRQSAKQLLLVGQRKAWVVWVCLEGGAGRPSLLIGNTQTPNFLYVDLVPRSILCAVTPGSSD